MTKKRQYGKIASFAAKTITSFAITEGLLYLYLYFVLGEFSIGQARLIDELVMPLIFGGSTIAGFYVMYKTEDDIVFKCSIGIFTFLIAVVTIAAFIVIPVGLFLSKTQ